MSLRDGVNQSVVLKSRPRGIPTDRDFDIANTPIPVPGEGEVLVRNIYWSVEPAMRGWVSDVANYSEPVAIGAVMRSFTSGVVVESRSPDYRPGDYATGMLGWQEFAVVADASVLRSVSIERVPLSTSLGVLGLNGLTAYFGLLDVGEPEPGETVVVSTAAGAVGSCVGQIAKAKGCRTVGITGGAEKATLCVEEFGFDAVVDYKADDFDDQLARALDGGVDVYFDNTCGVISDRVMRHLNRNARIIVCGTAAVADWNPLPMGPRVHRQLLVARARMQGILVLDYAQRHAEALAQLQSWVLDHTIRYLEDVSTGVDAAPDAIASLYRGENMGKRLIQVAALDGSDLG